MASIVVAGDTSGTVTLSAPATAGTTTLTLPTTTGTVLASNSASTINSGTSSSMTLQTNGTTAVTIDTSQNVGIGTTSPSQKVEINNANGDVYLKASRGVQSLLIGANSTGATVQSSATDPLYFATNGSERMRIDSSGRVGINNTSPIAIFNPIGSTIFQRYSGGYNTYGRIEVYATQSNFSNPTVDLFTTTITGSTFAGCMIKVRVFQLNWGATQGNIHAGNAIICGNGAGSYSTNVSTMAIEGSGFTMTNVGTLSWSGTTLRYTCNRASNYDTYTITVEYGAHQNLISMVPASANLV